MIMNAGGRLAAETADYGTTDFLRKVTGIGQEEEE